MNTEHTLEAKIAAAANRLKMIQADFAHEPESVQNDYLSDEIERMLQEIQPHEKKAFLEGLRDCFPIAIDANNLSKPKSLEQTNPFPVEDSGRRNPEILAEQLISQLNAADSETRNKVLAKLASAGLIPKSTQEKTALSDELKDKLKTLFGLDNLGDYTADELLCIVVLLGGVLNKLEPLIWNTWTQLAPRSSIRPKGSIKENVRAYLTNPKQTDTKQMTEQMQFFQQMATALVTAISRAGDQFSSHFLSTYSPNEIAALVKVESSNIWVSQKTRCWDKYQQLAGSLTHDSIEQQIRKSLVEYVESLLQLRR